MIDNKIISLQVTDNRFKRINLWKSSTKNNLQRNNSNLTEHERICFTEKNWN